MAEDLVEGNAAGQDAAGPAATAGEAVGAAAPAGGVAAADSAPAGDVVGDIITERKKAKKRNLLIAEAAAIVIAVVVIAAFALVYIHPAARAVTAASTAPTTVLQGSANSSMAGLVAQLNHTWNSTEINSSSSNSSYDMIGSIGSIG